jgi:translation initiation factor 2D
LRAFYYGVHHQRNTHKKTPYHGLSFPIPQSLIISHLVLPYLPIWTSKQASSLQIKKTSWKSARKFIKALDKQKLLKSKDRDGGEIVVVEIGFDDPAFTNFVPYHLPKKEASVGLESEGSGKTLGPNPSSSDESIGQKLSDLHLLKPKDQLSPIFEASNASIKALFLAMEVRAIANSYIDSENLVCATNKHFININPFLANAIFDGKSSLDHEILAKGSVPRDALMERILEKCLPFFAILRNDDTRETMKAKAGQFPKIQLIYETRSGNKTVTKISGLEAFHINPQPLADELQKACASSTSVGQLMGSSPKNPVMEVVVQGPQKDMVLKALEKRGVKPKWVDHVNKVKGGKKGGVGQK